MIETFYGYPITSDESLAILHLLIASLYQFDHFLDFGKELRLLACSAPKHAQTPNYFNDKIYIFNSALGQRSIPIGFTNDKYFTQMEIFLCFQTLHAKSSNNYTIMLVKLTETFDENIVKTLFDEIHELGPNHAIQALYLKYRPSVTKTLSNRTRVVKVLGAMIGFRGELK